MHILGIETSCDETAAAVIKIPGKGDISVLSDIVSSQVKLYSRWGGVVPNLAAREHTKNIIPVISRSLAQAKIKLKDIDLISVTSGPGLIPALIIGVSTAKTLSYLFKKPLLGIHHIEGHIYANFIADKIGVNPNSQIKFPLLCLVVSGGHTQLVLMKKHLDYKVIGETLDDAAGEAFDKVARILELGYPGGPAIAACANQSQKMSNINLPRPMINSKNLDFSFSGLKTAVLYKVRDNKEILRDKKLKAVMCREFQQAVIDVLISKTISAAKKYNPRTISIAGGVSANLELRKQLGESVKKKLPRAEYKIPDIIYSVDNATMIAVAGYFRWKNKKDKSNSLNAWKELSAKANWKLK